MGRLDCFDISSKDFAKYNIKTDPESGLELPTEYEKLCLIRDMNGNIDFCKCQNCAYLDFYFNQNNYQISYLCKKQQDLEININDIQETRLCKFFTKKENS